MERKIVGELYETSGRTKGDWLQRPPIRKPCYPCSHRRKYRTLYDNYERVAGEAGNFCQWSGLSRRSTRDGSDPADSNGIEIGRASCRKEWRYRGATGRVKEKANDNREAESIA